MTNHYGPGVKTMGVGLTPCIIPAVGKATFALENDEMEVGLGTKMHGSNLLDTDRTFKVSTVSLACQSKNFKQPTKLWISSLTTFYLT